jgi:hypothetical protein
MHHRWQAPITEEFKMNQVLKASAIAFVAVTSMLVGCAAQQPTDEPLEGENVAQAQQALTACPSTNAGKYAMIKYSRDVAGYLLGGPAPTLPATAACTTFKGTLDALRAKSIKGVVKNPQWAVNVFNGELLGAKVQAKSLVCTKYVRGFQFDFANDIDMQVVNPAYDVPDQAVSCLGSGADNYFWMDGSGGECFDAACDITYTRIVIDPETAKLNASLLTATSSSTTANAVGLTTGAALRAYYVPSTISSTLPVGTPCSTTSVGSGTEVQSVLVIPVGSTGIPLDTKRKCVAPGSTLFPTQ